MLSSAFCTHFPLEHTVSAVRLYAGGEEACGACPFSLLCSQRKPLFRKGAPIYYVQCSDCQALLWYAERDKVVHVCSNLAEGVWERGSNHRYAGSALRSARVTSVFDSLVGSSSRRVCGGDNPTPCHFFYRELARQEGILEYPVGDDPLYPYGGDRAIYVAAREHDIILDSQEVYWEVEQLLDMQRSVATLSRKILQYTSEQEKLRRRIDRLIEKLARKN